MHTGPLGAGMRDASSTYGTWRTHGDGNKMRLVPRFGRIRTAELSLGLAPFLQVISFQRQSKKK
jgi:hypothetical protein